MGRRILITGSGMLGSALATAGNNLGYEVISLSRDDLDITDAAGVGEAIRSIRPDHILHTAALTKVNYCEANPEEAKLVNVQGTKNVVNAAEEIMAHFVFFSSDYVFDGESKQEWVESDKPDPINVYGLTKMAGEKLTRDYFRSSIVRTSGVFGERSDGKVERNFVAAIAGKLFSEDSSELKIVADQQTCITYNVHLASMFFNLLQESLPQVMHLTSSGKHSWYEWAKLIAEILGKDSSRLSPVHADEYDSGIRRPLNSVLVSEIGSIRSMATFHSGEVALRMYIDNLRNRGLLS